MYIHALVPAGRARGQNETAGCVVDAPGGDSFDSDVDDQN
jgi:hypothetical protein